MEQEKRNKLLKILLTACALLAGAFLAWGAFVEPNRLVVRRTAVQLPGLPPELEGCRALVVADTHFGSSFLEKKRRDRLINAIRAEKADISFLLGDYIAAGSIPRYKAMKEEDLVTFFRSLQAPLGSYAVLGNHELWYGRKKMRELLEKAGVSVIENKAVKVKNHLTIAGLPDFATTPVDWKKTALFLKEATPALILTHKGRILRHLPLSPEVLTLAADTHGGQVRLPWIGSLYNLRFRQPELPTGISNQWGKKLFITSGAGGHRLNFRFLCPPEIAVVTFTGSRSVKEVEGVGAGEKPF